MCVASSDFSFRRSRRYEETARPNFSIARARPILAQARRDFAKGLVHAASAGTGATRREAGNRAFVSAATCATPILSNRRPPLLKSSAFEPQGVPDRIAASAGPQIMPDIPAIQKALREQSLHGWLFYYFRHRDPSATSVLGLGDGMSTRRWFYLIPAKGTPRKLVHKIESRALDSLLGTKLEYASLEELDSNLRRVLKNARTVAMQYSP